MLCSSNNEIVEHSILQIDSDQALRSDVMINRVKIMLGRRQPTNALESYFFNVHKHADNTGPTFDEARRDFREMVRRHIYN